MFIEIEELKSHIYQYQIEQITEFDDDIVYMAINAAIDEVRSYVTPTGKRGWADGRPLYNADLIFSAIGLNRNALLLQVTKTIAVWNLIMLCNVDMLYEQWKERYDRAVTWLKQLNTGAVAVSGLPVLSTSDTEADAYTGSLPFRFGTRAKFNHE